MKALGPFLALCLLLAVATLLFAAVANHQAQQTPPIKLGTSGGNILDSSKRYCCSGTLGSVVTKGGINYILSNNHVLARLGQATDGEDISQPGLIDNGCRVPPIVADFSQAASAGTPLGSNVDAALATVRSGQVTSTGEILEVGVPSATTANAALVGVAKSGRTTGLTCGTIGSINTSVNVQYQNGCNQGKKFTVGYSNQVVVNSSSFSAGGDSGSLIVTSGGAQPIALLFAGSSTTTIGNPITEVASKLGISFVGGGNHNVACPTGAAAAATVEGVRPAAHEIDRVNAVKERHAPRLMSDPAVLAVGVGAHADNPIEAALVVYVDQGRALGRPIPAVIDGARVQVYRTDTIRAYGWNERKGANTCSDK